MTDPNAIFASARGLSEDDGADDDDIVVAPGREYFVSLGEEVSFTHEDEEDSR